MTSTFCFLITIKRWFEFSDRLACRLDSAVWSPLFSNIAHTCHMSYVSVILNINPLQLCEGYCYCFHCFWVWLHCFTESGREWAKCSKPSLKSPLRVTIWSTVLHILHIINYWSSYLNPRRRQQPYEPSLPVFPHSPASTPHNTAGVTDPWKILHTDFRW